LIVAGLEGEHFTAFAENGDFDRNWDAWSAVYSTPTFPLYFYLGQGLMHGYIPVEDYDSFAEALGHTVVFEPQPNPTGLRTVIQESARWVGEPNPFQFVEFPELNDLRVELNDVIVTGWTRVITATPDTFEAEWETFLSEWDRVGGADWVAAYQSYYDGTM